MQLVQSVSGPGFKAVLSRYNAKPLVSRKILSKDTLNRLSDPARGLYYSSPERKKATEFKDNNNKENIVSSIIRPSFFLTEDDEHEHNAEECTAEAFQSPVVVSKTKKTLHDAIARGNKQNSVADGATLSQRISLNRRIKGNVAPTQSNCLGRLAERSMKRVVAQTNQIQQKMKVRAQKFAMVEKKTREQKISENKKLRDRLVPKSLVQPALLRSKSRGDNIVDKIRISRTAPGKLSQNLPISTSSNKQTQHISYQRPPRKLPAIVPSVQKTNFVKSKSTQSLTRNKSSASLLDINKHESSNQTICSSQQSKSSKVIKANERKNMNSIFHESLSNVIQESQKYTIDLTSNLSDITEDQKLDAMLANHAKKMSVHLEAISSYNSKYRQLKEFDGLDISMNDISRADAEIKCVPESEI